MGTNCRCTLAVVSRSRSKFLQKSTLALYVFLPLALTPKLTIDAVNPGKFFLIVLAGSFAALQLTISQLNENLRRPIIIMGGLLVAGTLMPLMFSGAPFLQQVFGSEGRNIGLLTYFACYFTLAFGIIIAREISTPVIGYMFLLSAIFAVLYGLLQANGIDFVRWSYPAVFGSLGNVNFYSAQISIIASGIVCYICFKDANKSLKISFSCLLFLCMYLLFRANSSQGFFIVVISLLLALHIVICRKTSGFWWIIPIISSVSTAVGVIGLLGVGPFSSLLADQVTTLKFRVYFWQAGFNMFVHHPLYGVGLDSFGDWYRFSRTFSAYNGGDLGEVADSAHNFLIELAATGGISLLLFGLVLIILVMRSAIIVIVSATSKENRLSPLEISSALCAIAFLLQSLVSPQQIGIMSWGFLVCGLCIGYSQKSNSTTERMPLDVVKKNNSRRTLENTSGTITNIIGGLAVLAIMILPSSLVLKEFRMISAQKSNDLDSFVSAIIGFPTSAHHYRYGISILEGARYYGPSASIGIRASREYPRNYRLIETVSTLRALDSTTLEKLRVQLDVLDPPR